MVRFGAECLFLTPFVDIFGSAILAVERGIWSLFCTYREYRLCSIRLAFLLAGSTASVPGISYLDGSTSVNATGSNTHTCVLTGLDLTKIRHHYLNLNCNPLLHKQLAKFQQKTTSVLMCLIPRLLFHELDMNTCKDRYVSIAFSCCIECFTRV